MTRKSSRKAMQNELHHTFPSSKNVTRPHSKAAPPSSDDSSYRNDKITPPPESDLGILHEKLSHAPRKSDVFETTLVISDSEPEEEEEIEEIDSDLLEKSRKSMGEPVHGEELDSVEIILRVFDNQEEWGPSVNISRLDRYKRAVALGLNPPSEIESILTKSPLNANLNHSIFSTRST